MNDAAATDWVIEVTESDFQEEVVNRSQEVPVVVDFWAEWCGPCRTLGPLLEKLAKEKNGAFVMAKVNVDECPELAGYFQIEGIPAIRVIHKAQLTNGFNGLLPEKELRSFIDEIASGVPKVDPFKEMAEKESTNPAEAEAFYRKILAEDPDQEQARIGLARVLVAAHKDEEASHLIAPLGMSGEIGAEAEKLRRILEFRTQSTEGQSDEAALRKQVIAEPTNGEARFKLGELLAQRERYPEALDMLLQAAECDRELGKTKVRELMVKIWEIIGVRSDLADETRDKLRSLLY